MCGMTLKSTIIIKEIKHTVNFEIRLNNYKLLKYMIFIVEEFI